MIRLILAVRRRARKAAETLRSLAEDILHPYRRELYYMRGPGPKWRAKHGLQPAGRTEQIS